MEVIKKYELTKDLSRKRQDFKKGTQVFLTKKEGKYKNKWYDLHLNWVCDENTYTSNNYITEVVESL